MNPNIIYEDQNLIVLSKPSGLLSQGEHTGDLNVVDWLRGYLGRPYVGLVHRLDRNTSGLMVVAKRTKAASRLTQALQEGSLVRRYLAWVCGSLKQEVLWHHRLMKDEKNNQVKVVRSGGKEAVLRARPMRSGVWEGLGLTLVEFELETGRSHQIRVQSSHEGFPLLGDSKYGARSPGSRFPRLALHSHYLEFPHPIGGKVLSFSDPLPPELCLNE